MQTITVKSIINGATYQYIDNGDPKSGTAKNVYFSPDKKYVVAITCFLIQKTLSGRIV